MKTSLFKRVLALLFAVLMLVSVVACTKNPDAPKESDKPAETDPAGPQGSDGSKDSETEIKYIPKGFYGGETYTVLAYDPIEQHNWSNVPYDLYYEENEGDVLANAVYQRGVILKDELGVQLEVVRWPKNVSEELLRDINDGEYRYQLVFQCTINVNILVNNGTIRNINRSGLNIDNPWFDTNAASMFTIKGKTTAVTCDMTFLDKLSTVAVFYNKQMASDNNLGDLYSMVNNKEWTYDKMLAMAETVVPTVDADGVYTVDDIYGISCQNDGAYFFLHSAGLSSISHTADGGLTLTLNSENTTDALEKILALTTNKRIYLNRQSTATNMKTAAEIAEHFASGKALFLIRPLQSLYDLAQVTDNYGIIPVPMFDAETQDKYYTPVNTYASMHLCLPNYITDEEKTVDVVEYLSWYSMKNITPVLYEVVLGSRMTQDKESSKMLDIIFANRFYDIGLIWNISSIRSIITDTIGAGFMVPGTVKQRIDKYATPINVALNTLLTDLEKFDTDQE